MSAEFEGEKVNSPIAVAPAPNAEDAHHTAVVFDARGVAIDAGTGCHNAADLTAGTGYVAAAVTLGVGAKGCSPLHSVSLMRFLAMGGMAGVDLP